MSTRFYENESGDIKDLGLLRERREFASPTLCEELSCVRKFEEACIGDCSVSCRHILFIFF